MSKRIITPAQCRMGRALLDWSQPDLAARAALSVTTVLNFESGEGRAGIETLTKLATVFELAGVALLDSGGVEPSARLVTVLEGPDANYRVMADALSTLAGGGEGLIAGLTEAGSEEAERRAFVVDHLRKLEAAGISERILLKHGDRNLIARPDWYRWMPKGAEIGAAFHLYGNKIAMKDLNGVQRIVVIEHELFAATVRGMFNVVWAQATPVVVP